MPRTSTRTANRRLSLVVVDDDHDVRTMLRARLLREPSFALVGEAGDGHEAVEVAAATQPDVILLDLIMPNVSGIEAIPRLRSVAPGARIVVHSSAGDRMNDALARGAHSAVAKSGDWNELRDHLLQLDS